MSDIEGDWDKDRNRETWERTEIVSEPSDLPTGTPTSAPNRLSATLISPVSKGSNGLRLNDHHLETTGTDSEDDDAEDGGGDEGQRMLKSPRTRGRGGPRQSKGGVGHSTTGALKLSEPEDVLCKGVPGRWRELRSLLAEVGHHSTPPSHS